MSPAAVALREIRPAREINLPNPAACAARVAKGQASPLEEFIARWEPRDLAACEEFNEGLAAVLREVTGHLASDLERIAQDRDAKTARLWTLKRECDRLEQTLARLQGADVLEAV